MTAILRYNFLQLMIALWSCTSQNDVVGTYINKSNRSCVLVLKSNNEFDYLTNGTLFNTGIWEYKIEGWEKITFINWKDMPSFNLRGCATNCLAIVNYDRGELIFKPDERSLNFEKQDKYGEFSRKHADIMQFDMGIRSEIRKLLELKICARVF